MSRRIDPLLRAMRDRPQDFEFSPSGCVLTHRPSSVQIWIGNGMPFYGFYQPEVPFSLIEKWRFGRAFRQMRHRYMAAVLAKFTGKTGQ